MTMPSQQFWIEIALIAVIGYGVKRAFDARSGRGMGVRLIQTLAVVMILPTILILAVEGLLKGEAVGTVLGVVVGYTLSGILKPVPSRKSTHQDDPGSN